VEQTPEQIHIRDYLVSVRPGIADRPSQTPELTLDAGLSRSIGDADIVSGVVSKTLTLFDHEGKGDPKTASRQSSMGII